MNNKPHYPVYYSIVLLLILSCIGISAKGQIITTIAGNGLSGFSGDGGLATAAKINHPIAMVFDRSGNLIFSDNSNSRIRKINLAGVITTICGTGTAGFSGDGGPATAANIRNVVGIAIDRHDNIYFADMNNNRIRVITSGGIIQTFAGTGATGYTGDGGPASAARLTSPTCLAFDNNGNLHVSCYDECIRKIDTNGIISTVAGTGTPGFSGDGGPATAAQLRFPWGIAFDVTGNLYVADVLNSRIRKISTSGIISTTAGIGTSGFSGDGGPATAAQFNFPFGVSVDISGNIFIADMLNNRIRMVSPLGIIVTIAGSGASGYSGDGGPATSASFYSPMAVATSSSGDLYIPDNANNRIRMVKCTSRPNAGTIMGAESVCEGANATLTTSAYGGTWSSSNNAIATINSSGVVTGVATGLVTISYIISSSCGGDTTSYAFRVKRLEDCSTGIGSLQFRLNGLQVYPNPNQGSFIVSVSSFSNEDALLTISNLLGQKAYESTVATNKETDIKLNVPPGIYFVVASLNGERFTSHLVMK